MIKMETQEELIIKRNRTKRPRPFSSSSCSTGRPQIEGEVEEGMANCLILLAQSCNERSSPQESMKETQYNKASSSASIPDKDVYQCKTCHRNFTSFQALGGHRASHKKPRHSSQESSNIEQLREERTMLSLQTPSRVFSCNNTSSTTKQRVHECSICGAEFSSGQALGGHMRRHRPIPVVTTNNEGEEFPLQVEKKQTIILGLDLNLPAPDDQDGGIASKFGYSPSKEQVIIFSASPLVRCHY